MSGRFPTQLSALAQWLPQSAIDGDCAFQGVSIDTRQLVPGNLFIALQGSRDGHDFIQTAADAGAVGALVMRSVSELPFIAVPDTTAALTDLGRAYRGQYDGLVMALTGSQGKTSTRGFLGAIMAAASAPDRVIVTRANLNNHLGVPLTLMRLHDAVETIVLELGASAVGEIAALGALSRPHIGCVLNARDAHLEGFGSLKNIVQGKGELIDCVSLNGTVVLPADEPAFAAWQPKVGSRDLWTFGRTEADVRYLPKSDRRMALSTPFGDAELELPTLGLHFMANAAAATAMAMAAGVDLDTCLDGLSRAQIEPGRMTPLTALDGRLIVDDTYNASPQAVRAAIDWLAAQSGQRLLVLGGLAELGSESEALMAELGRYAQAAGIEYLITCGQGRAIGRDAPVTAHFESIDALVDGASLLPQAEVTLVKGSRSARMDRLVDVLTGRMEGTH